MIVLFKSQNLQPVTKNVLGIQKTKENLTTLIRNKKVPSCCAMHASYVVVQYYFRDETVWGVNFYQKLDTGNSWKINSFDLCA